MMVMLQPRSVVQTRHNIGGAPQRFCLVQVERPLHIFADRRSMLCIRLWMRDRFVSSRSKRKRQWTCTHPFIDQSRPWDQKEPFLCLRATLAGDFTVTLGTIARLNDADGCK